MTREEAIKALGLMEQIESIDGDFCAEGPGCPHEINAETANHLLELAQAEKDGRLMVLPPNDPLTLEELREMDGEPVWITKMDGSGGVWMLVDTEYELCREAHGEMAVFEERYGK